MNSRDHLLIYTHVRFDQTHNWNGRIQGIANVALRGCFETEYEMNRLTIATATVNTICLQITHSLYLKYASKGIWRQGVSSFCKKLLCFNTMPCRHMPLLVHSWLYFKMLNALKKCYSCRGDSLLGCQLSGRLETRCSCWGLSKVAFTTRVKTNTRNICFNNAVRARNKQKTRRETCDAVRERQRKRINHVPCVRKAFCTDWLVLATSSLLLLRSDDRVSTRCV